MEKIQSHAKLVVVGGGILGVSFKNFSLHKGQVLDPVGFITWSTHSVQMSVLQQRVVLTPWVG